jgi:hypothetical protein
LFGLTCIKPNNSCREGCFKLKGDGVHKVKQDLNLIDRPMWVVSDDVIKTRIVGAGKDQYTVRGFQDGDYTYEVCGPIPDRFANNVLFVLTKQALEDDTDTLFFNLKQLSEACGKKRSTTVYNNILRAFDAWEKTTIKFQNNSFRTRIQGGPKDGFVEKFETIVFSPIDSWAKTSTIENGNAQFYRIRLGAEFLRITRESNYYKYIDLKEFQRFSSDVAARLYELLSKSFWKRSTWSICARRLAVKLTLNERYPSKIKIKIDAALKQVNKNTSLNIKLAVSKNKDEDDLLFVFTNQTEIPVPMPSLGDVEASAPEAISEIPLEILNLIPETNRAGCRNLCLNIFNENGAKGLQFYIEKCNARRKTKQGSYSGYLKTIFDADIYSDHLVDQKAIESRYKAEQQKIMEELKGQNDQGQAQKEEMLARKTIIEMEQTNPKQWQRLREEAAMNLGVNLNRIKRGEKMRLILEMMSLYNLTRSGL